MDIGLINNWSNYPDHHMLSVTTKQQDEFELTKTEKTEMDYYLELRKEFPDVAFVVVENSLPVEVGLDSSLLEEYRGVSDIDSFGYLNKPSIELDIKLLEKIRQNPEYMEKVTAVIKHAVYMHDTYCDAALQSGMQYVSMQLRENAKGEIALTASLAPVRFDNLLSTEKENSKSFKDIYLDGILHNIAAQKYKALFSMMDKIQDNHTETIRFLKENDRKENSLEKQKTAEYEKTFLFNEQ